MVPALDCIGTIGIAVAFVLRRPRRNSTGAVSTIGAQAANVRRLAELALLAQTELADTTLSVKCAGLIVMTRPSASIWRVGWLAGTVGLADSLDLGRMTHELERHRHPVFCVVPDVIRVLKRRQNLAGDRVIRHLCVAAAPVHEVLEAGSKAEEAVGQMHAKTGHLNVCL